MGKGVSFSKEDAKDLAILLNSYLELDEEDLERPLTNEEMLAELKEQGGM